MFCFLHGSKMTMKIHCALLWQHFRWISSSWADEEASSGKLRHRAISILMNFHTVLILKLNTCLILPLRCFCALSQWVFHNFFPVFRFLTPPCPHLSCFLLRYFFILSGFLEWYCVMTKNIKVVFVIWSRALCCYILCICTVYYVFFSWTE